MTSTKMPVWTMPALKGPMMAICNGLVAILLPVMNRVKTQLAAVLKSRDNVEWSNLTRSRRVDVMVGLTLHCLLMSLQVVTVFAARVTRWAVVLLYVVILKAATILGFVRPLRLLRDSTEVRKQLQSATVLRIAGYNLVLFEGLRNEEFQGD